MIKGRFSTLWPRQTRWALLVIFCEFGQWKVECFSKCCLTLNGNIRVSIQVQKLLGVQLVWGYCKFFQDLGPIHFISNCNRVFLFLFCNLLSWAVWTKHLKTPTQYAVPKLYHSVKHWEGGFNRAEGKKVSISFISLRCRWILSTDTYSLGLLSYIIIILFGQLSIIPWHMILQKWKFLMRWILNSHF